MERPAQICQTGNRSSSSSDFIDEQTATRGYAILQTDSNQVDQLIRLQNTLTPLNDNEIAIKYKIQNRRIFLGAESFFFEEGQATLYQNAMYGGLKVDDKGESLLVGLYDENFQYIQPDK
ncbi:MULTISPECIES: GDYXXLXY domain-containing protein [Bacteroidaceae]|uniref:GDYXXLXY domain-containing protein n=1 Tax=Bacteroides acidifaciens TaxID=85831 RepID=UPI0010086816|nr:GDYXXLXY domain-containing protein [Bacteroides acidifaciens]